MIFLEQVSLYYCAFTQKSLDLASAHLFYSDILGMFHKTYQRIILVVLLLIIVIYGLRKLIHYDKGQDLPLVLGTVYGTDKIEKQSTSLPVPEVKHDKGQDLPLVHETVYHTDKIEKQSTSLPVPEVKHDKGQDLPLVHETVYHTDKIEKQSTSLPVSEVRKVNIKRQQNSISNSFVKIDSFLLNLIKNGSKFKNYVSNLSSPQVESLIKQIEVSNLTSRKAQEEFLVCGGISIFRRLKGPDPETPIPVIPSHQHCKKMSFKNSGPIVSLSSIPGSGNSYVRQLLESATGIYTGAVWCDPTYINAGMIGEGVDTNNVIAVKLHYYGPSGTKKFLNNDKSIYIIRSPFGAILSEHTRNVARNSQKYSSLGDSHVLEIDYKYGMCKCVHTCRLTNLKRNKCPLILVFSNMLMYLVYTP